MLRLFKNKRAQNTAEYAIMIVIVIGVFSAMQLYIRRGLQARIKGGTDNIPGAIIGQYGGNVGVNILGNVGGNQYTQYEPYYYQKGYSNMMSITSEGTEYGTIKDTGGLRNLVNASSGRTGQQQIVGSTGAD